MTRLLRTLLLLAAAALPASAGAGSVVLDGTGQPAAPIHAALDGSTFLVVSEDPRDHAVVAEARVLAAFSALVQDDAACGLRTLVLGVRVSARALAELRGSCITGLERLHLSGGGLDDEAARTLATLPFVANLRNVTIDGRSPGPEGLRAVLAAAPRLEWLHFSVARSARSAATSGSPPAKTAILASPPSPSPRSPAWAAG